ncbi:MAG: hypothetical protein Ct9H300mP26_5390 [Acidimicrobiales bacterium]|nr:MAG: hypothetical protein Ct9H300mP26_5390 [Acidimicrobiales bacterium]
MCWSRCRGVSTVLFSAALMKEQGHDVTGVTLKLWGGPQDQGCCSVSDVDDARRVAQQLDIDHFVFNYGEEFDRHVVGPYVDAHAGGLTPNPCIECNRHIKFDALVSRAKKFGDLTSWLLAITPELSKPIEDCDSRAGSMTAKTSPTSYTC